MPTILGGTTGSMRVVQEEVGLFPSLRKLRLVDVLIPDLRACDCSI